MTAIEPNAKRPRRVAIIGGYSFVANDEEDSAALEQSQNIAKSLGQASLRRLDPLSQYAIYAIHQARLDSGIGENDSTNHGSKGGVCVGTALGAQRTRIRYAQRLVLHGLTATNPIDFPDSIDGAPAAHVAIRWGLQGPSLTFADGETSAINALVAACRQVANARAERMYVVAGDAFDPLIRDAIAKSSWVKDTRIQSIFSDSAYAHEPPANVILALILEHFVDTAIDERTVEVVGFQGSNCEGPDLGPESLVRDVTPQNKEMAHRDLCGASLIAGAWHGVTAPMCKNGHSCQDSGMNVRGYRCKLDDARFPNLAFQTLAR